MAGGTKWGRKICLFAVEVIWLLVLDKPVLPHCLVPDRKEKSPALTMRPARPSTKVGDWMCKYCNIESDFHFEFLFNCLDP